ncbi:uncharacterized protein LOC144240167 [Crocuta crocuta]
MAGNRSGELETFQWISNCTETYPLLNSSLFHEDVSSSTAESLCFHVLIRDYEDMVPPFGLHTAQRSRSRSTVVVCTQGFKERYISRLQVNMALSGVYLPLM